MSEGIVFDIQRFCTHDGPGIRTVVFFKGCPLDCGWCHNPESKSFQPEILWSERLCTRCGKCVEACSSGAHVLDNGVHAFDRSRCRLSLACVEACPGGALEVAGRRVTVEQVLEEVEKDRVFYEESGGGLTLSGGEPMAQFAFARELLRAAKSAGLHTCVETSGFGETAQFVELAGLVDLFLWDLKDTDPLRYQANTGANLDVVLRNLHGVDACGGKTLLRCILIAGVNMTTEHLDGIASIYHGLRHCGGVELLPYHPLGGAKYERIGRVSELPAFKSPAREQSLAAARYLNTSKNVQTAVPEFGGF